MLLVCQCVCSPQRHLPATIRHCSLEALADGQRWQQCSKPSHHALFPLSICLHVNKYISLSCIPQCLLVAHNRMLQPLFPPKSGFLLLPYFVLYLVSGKILLCLVCLVLICLVFDSLSSPPAPALVLAGHGVSRWDHVGSVCLYDGRRPDCGVDLGRLLCLQVDFLWRQIPRPAEWTVGVCNVAGGVFSWLHF